MNTRQIITYIIFNCYFIFFLTSCKNDTTPQARDEHSHTEETHDHSETPSNITSITQAQAQSINLQLDTIANKELTAAIKANGLLSVPNNNKGNATSLYVGVVKSLLVQIGSHISKGQKIATIANPQFIQLQEEYLTINSKIQLATDEYQRQESLQAGNAGAMKNLQNASAELKILKSRKASLSQQLKMMGINPIQITNSNLQTTISVHSPINGVVSNVFAKIGSYVDVSTPIAEIVDNNSLHLDLQVFEKDLPILKVGQIVHFTLTNNPTQEYDAIIYSIGSSFENDSKTIAVHCKVTGNKSGLIDGMNITGIVSLNNITAPAVPNNAIVNDDGKYYVFIVVDNTNDNNEPTNHNTNKPLSFEKVEVVKGVSNSGYTAVTFIKEMPRTSKIVTNGAFFINAKLTNTGEHEH